MGNLCCLSSKQHKNYYHKSADTSPINNTSHLSANHSFNKKGLGNNKKFNRQNEIDYYYDDYEELGHSNISRTNLTKKAKKQQNSKQGPRQRKSSNKSALSYYAQDLRMQDSKNALNSTQTTLLNTTGLDTKPNGSSQLLNESYRDNSKIINHLSNSKNNILMNSQGNLINISSNHNNGAKQLSRANIVQLNNQILINPNDKSYKTDNYNDKQNPETPTTFRDNSSDLCSTSASSILISSSQISSKSSKSYQNSSIQSAHPQSQSSTYIDPKKNLLNHIQENEDFESEPNLLTNKLRIKKENSRNLSNRPRMSLINQSLNEKNRNLTRSYSESSNGDELEGRKNQVIHNEPAGIENNAITDLNWKKYKSLQKSKRSIKNIEETMKSSRSIEQWLNDFSKLDREGDLDAKNENGLKSGPLITKRKLVKLEKIKRSRTSLDENDENNFNEELNLQSQGRTIICDDLIENQAIKKHRTDSTSSSIMHLDLSNTSNETSIATDASFTDSTEFSDDLLLKNFFTELSRLFSTNIINNNFTTHPQTCNKLFDTIEFLMQSNRPKLIKKKEQKLAKELSEYLLPRSNANSDDIDLLKWFLYDEKTLNLKLIEPVINETVCSNDHLTYSMQKNTNYLLIADSLRIKLVEAGEDSDNSEVIDIDDLDAEKIENLASNSLSGPPNEFLRFELDSTYEDGEQVSISTGELILEKMLIEALIGKEKKIMQKLSNKMGLVSNDENHIETDINVLNDKNLLEQLRIILNTSNFKGAQSLYNIKKKQTLNRKNIATPSILTKKNVNSLLSPISINSNCGVTPQKRNPSNNSSGTTSPSSSSISPASSNRLSNNNTLMDSTPNGRTEHLPYSFMQCNDSTNQFLIQPVAPSANAIQFFDINERLFACLLSNFSCQLVENFLKNSNNNLTSTGFIRKKKTDKSFQYIEIHKNENHNIASNEFERNNISHSKNRPLNLIIEKSNFKLCLKCDKWPKAYQQGFFNRKRINKLWPTKNILEDIYFNQCLITYFEPTEHDHEIMYDSEFQNQEDSTLYDEEKLNASNRIYSSSAKWQLNTSYAESTLFKSLSKQNTFRFYYLYLVFMNLNVQLSSETKTQLKKTSNSSSSPRKMAQNSRFYLFNFINEKIFMHHYFRFLEIEEESTFENELENSFDATLLNLINLLKKFNNYLKFVLEKYKCLNQPNYFDLNKSILSINELKFLFGANFGIEFRMLFDLMNRDIGKALNDFNIILNNNLINKLHPNSNGLVKLKEIQVLKQNQHYPANLLGFFNTFLDTIQIRLPNNTSLTNLQLSPLPAHYNANTYLYEYVYEYASIIFEQFKSKRDQFKISESLLLQLHKQVLSEKFSPLLNNQNRFVAAIEQIDPDRLFSKFEEYAECVHKYLPQIRHNNQYLLFHYVWTMQVQYMAPFFNYLCDFYPAVE